MHLHQDQYTEKMWDMIDGIHELNPAYYAQYELCVFEQDIDACVEADKIATEINNKKMNWMEYATIRGDTYPYKAEKDRGD